MRLAEVKLFEINCVDDDEGRDEDNWTQAPLRHCQSTVYTELAHELLKIYNNAGVPIGLGTGDMVSYYKQIKGVKYDRSIIEQAESLTSGQGDGRISKDDANQLWEGALDGKGVTACESKTLQYVLDNYKFTDSARNTLQTHLGGEGEEQVAVPKASPRLQAKVTKAPSSPAAPRASPRLRPQRGASDAAAPVPFNKAKTPVKEVADEESEDEEEVESEEEAEESEEEEVAKVPVPKISPRLRPKIVPVTSSPAPSASPRVRPKRNAAVPLKYQVSPPVLLKKSAKKATTPVKEAAEKDEDEEDDDSEDEEVEEDAEEEEEQEEVDEEGVDEAAAQDDGESSSEEDSEEDDDNDDVGDLVLAAAASMKQALKQASVAATMKQLPKMESQLKQLAASQPSSVEEICGDSMSHLDKVTGTSTAASDKKRGAGHKRQGDAGSGWFNMPEGKMTAEIKQDLKIIQMRNYLDPKKHMRTTDWKKSLPKHFQIGTVVDGKTDFYSGRVSKKNRQERITDSVLDDTKAKSYMKRAFSSIQEKSMSGRQKHMAAKRAKRAKKWMRT